MTVSIHPVDIASKVRLKLPEVIERLGVSRTTFLRMIENSEFPKPIRVGQRIIFWLEEDVTAYLAEQARQAGRTVSSIPA
jgi:prophage regulatory protein